MVEGGCVHDGFAKLPYHSVHVIRDYLRLMSNTTLAPLRGGSAAFGSGNTPPTLAMVGKTSFVSVVGWAAVQAVAHRTAATLRYVRRLRAEPSQGSGRVQQVDFVPALVPHGEPGLHQDAGGEVTPLTHLPGQ